MPLLLLFPSILSGLPQAVPEPSTAGADMIYSTCLYLFLENINAVLTGFINIDKINPETQGISYPLSIVHISITAAGCLNQTVTNIMIVGYLNQNLLFSHIGMNPLNSDISEQNPSILTRVLSVLL